MCVRAFSGSAVCGGESSFVHGEQQREEGEVKEGWKEGVRDMLLTEQGGAGGGTAEETQPFHLDFFQHREQ